MQPHTRHRANLLILAQFVLLSYGPACTSFVIQPQFLRNTMMAWRRAPVFQCNVRTRQARERGFAMKQQCTKEQPLFQGASRTRIINPRRAMLVHIAQISLTFIVAQPAMGAIQSIGIASTPSTPIADYAQGEMWGNTGTQVKGREFAGTAVKNLLKAKGVPTILQLNEAQQVLIECWSIITCFSLYQDFQRCGGQEGWLKILHREVDLLQDAPPPSMSAISTSSRKSSDAYAAINNALLPALGDRSAMLLLPEVVEEIEDINEGQQVTYLYGYRYTLPTLSLVV